MIYSALADLESHGGLYTLHSHLNHSCIPNLSARHLEQRTYLSRLTLVARAPIEPGAELCITYVDPGAQGGVERRRRQLLEWGFGRCGCARCVEEERAGPEEGKEKKEDGGVDELEKELKAGLGVV